MVVRGGFGFGHNPRFGVFLRPRPFLHRRHFFCPFPCGNAFPIVSLYPIYPYYPLAYQSDFVYNSGAAVDTYSASREAALASEVYRLEGEVATLRQQEASQAERQQYSRNMPTEATPPSVVTHPRQEVSPPLAMLVYRDGRRVEVQNYAVVGQTLWIFSEQRAHKVPIAELDLDATRRANEERGVEFPVFPR